jgi:Dolichyl-phosphate-mannose-protein mannosyltransferase
MRERASQDAGPHFQALALVFLLALLPRVAFLVLVEQPPISHDQVGYFFGGLSLAEHPDPVHFILKSDSWHTWIAPWVRVPLYYLFIGLVFRLFGRHPLPLQLFQCVLGAITAVLVAALGRRVDTRLGHWGGVAYALYWPAIAACPIVQAENLHVPLVTAGLLGLVTAASPRGAFGAGALLGLSTLARAVSGPFLFIAAASRFWRPGTRRTRAVAALAVLAGGVIVVGPWALRNRLKDGFWFLETTGTFNLWMDNGHGGRAADLSGDFLTEMPPPEASRLARLLAWRSIRRDPGALWEKVRMGIEHLFRPEGLHNLIAQDPMGPGWTQAAQVLLDDGLVVPAWMLFALFLVAGRQSDAWPTCVLWAAYYVTVIVVAFHVEIRYRSALVPVVFAGATGGLALIRQMATSQRLVVALVGVLGIGAMVGQDTARAALQMASVRLALRHVDSALSRHDVAAALRATREAASRDPLSPRPWIASGRRFLAAEELPAAIECFTRASEIRPPSLVPAAVLPRLLADVGRSSEATEAAQRAARIEDSSVALAVAWRELPVPRGTEIILGSNDYGAARGFVRRVAAGRWSGPRAELRLAPDQRASAFEATIEMASPEPSPWAAVSVLLGDLVGGRERSCVVRREVAPCTVLLRPAPDGSLRVALMSQAWSRDPAIEQGVLVTRMAVTPSSTDVGR